MLQSIDSGGDDVGTMEHGNLGRPGAIPLIRIWQSDQTLSDPIEALHQAGLNIGQCAQDLIRATKPISNTGDECRIAILPGTTFDDASRTTAAVKRYAHALGYACPPFETGPLLRIVVQDEALASWGFVRLIVMHQPLAVSSDEPLFLLALYRGDTGRWLTAVRGEGAQLWSSDTGFAFQVVA